MPLQPTGTSIPVTRRQSRPKSKFGCKTCKLRHVKCDETKPKCLRCFRSNSICDGYPEPKHGQQEKHSITSRPLRPSETVAGPNDILSADARNQLAQKSAVKTKLEIPEIAEPTNLLSLVPNPFCDFSGTSKEHRSFDFFVSRTISDLEIFLDSTLLTNILGELAISERSVQHAIVAVAAVHEDCLRELDSQEVLNQIFTIDQYNKAINSLNLRLSEDRFSHQIALISCVLFTYLEFLRGSLNMVFMHGRSGELLLTSYHRRFPPDNKQSKSSRVIDEKLDRIFARFRLSSFVSSPLCDPLDYQHLNEYPQYNHEDSFSSIQKAKDHLDCLIDRSFKPYYGPPKKKQPIVTEEEKSRRMLLIAQIQRWTFQLEQFTYNLSLTTKDLNSVRLLKIQSIMTIIWNYVSTAKHQTEFDNYTQYFASILALAESIIKSDDKATQAPTGFLPPPLKKTTPSSLFTFETSLIYPLYLTGLKCRSPTLRRRALSLISRLSSLDITWTTLLFSTIIQRAISFEESKCLVPPTEDRRTWTPENGRVQGVFFVPVYGTRMTQVVVWVWRPEGWEEWREVYAVERLPEKSLRGGEGVINGC